MRKILYLFFYLICIYNTYSQEPSKDNGEIDKVVNALFSEDEQSIDELMLALSKYQMLYVSLNYNSNSYFAGRDIGMDQYNLIPQIIYLHSSGIFGSISANYYEKFNPKLDVTTLAVGYGKNFGKHQNFRYGGYYSKYFYANSNDDFLDNSLSVSISAKNKIKTIGTSLYLSYLFGSKDAIQITSSSFATVKLLEKRKLSINLKPQISITAGKQTIELSRVSSIEGFPLTTYYSDNVFDLINTQLNIPVQFSLNSFDVEIGYYINFPNAIEGETDLKNTSFLNVSIAYLISL
ncbi:hypothetical protein R3X25_09885 [Lutibacter sp. TH_r2]|uniref:hypothetical protein n=1 Tax=Lutibacter sp. TH_r2 TaxID=3082083 RepID=UPI0029533DE2|nr:hypothetical protein [Lutibacter sp. TH_r2]MDV7187590.1 hypothetical protein [Lutibacter sp. TH_r2]